jgi:hypothetical protein
MAETAAIIGLVGSAVSGITGFIGARQQAAATSEAANYQSQVARNNQTIASQNAQQQSQAAAIQAQNADLKNRAIEGGILASQGASGIDIASGSSDDVRRSARQVGRLDTETIYSNALNNVRSSLQQSRNFGAQSQLDAFQAKTSAPNFLTGAGSLVGGASSFADKWLRYQTSFGSV